MHPIYIADQDGNLINLSDLFARVAKLEKRIPLFEIPKQRRRKKSERTRLITKQLLNSYK